MSQSPEVPLELGTIRAYLDSDSAIVAWRQAQAESEVAEDADRHRMASNYIDAFQSVRLALTGETLP